MKKKEKLSENVRVRLKPNEKETLVAIAKQENISPSEFIRKAVSDKISSYNIMGHAGSDENPSSSHCIAIQHNLIKNEIMNRIQGMNIAKSIKEKIMKELNTIG